MSKSKHLTDDELTLIVKGAKKASKDAVRVSTALELSIQFIKDGKLIEKQANGSIKIIKPIERVKSKTKAGKGTRLCLVAKD